MNELLFIYFAGGAMLMVTLIGLVIAIILPILDRWDKHFFILLFSVFLLTMFSFFTDLMVFQDPNMALLEKVAAFFEHLFPAILIALPTIYLLKYCGESRKTSRLFHITVVLFVLFLALLIVTQFTTFIYYVTPDNNFVRGPLFFILMLPIVAIMVINLTGVIRRRKELSKKVFIAFLIYLCPFLISLIIHMFVTVYLLIDFSVFISMLAMFILIILDQLEYAQLQQKEIARQKANIMVLQMRPHFIYNSLTTIYYLCEQNSKKAQQVIMDFTTYLRKNFTAISRDDTIPFLEELEHTRAYLAVEKALHEDLLFIDYDTPYSGFRLPPLTLQPIVENAIKHGLDPDAEPLHISITTRKTVAGAEIVVTDNGIGFDPIDEADPNNTLSNIRQRLDMMCNGKMIITPRKEGGTCVKVVIPQHVL